jgi:hypothetical protein
MLMKPFLRPFMIATQRFSAVNCLRQGVLRASRDLKGEIRVVSPDRSLSREILFLFNVIFWLHETRPFEEGGQR